MQPTSHAAMSGGDASQAESRRDGCGPEAVRRQHGLRLEPEGPGLDAVGAAGPSSTKKIQPIGCPSGSLRKGSSPEGRRRPSPIFTRGAASGGSQLHSARRVERGLAFRRMRQAFLGHERMACRPSTRLERCRSLVPCLSPGHAARSR